MQTLDQALAVVSILANAVIYGTDFFCAIVLRPALANVNDAVLTSAMGEVHRYGDRRMPIPGVIGVVTALLSVVIAAVAGRPGAAISSGVAHCRPRRLAGGVRQGQRSSEQAAHRGGYGGHHPGQRPYPAAHMGQRHQSARRASADRGAGTLLHPYRGLREKPLGRDHAGREALLRGHAGRPVIPESLSPSRDRH